MGPDKPLPYNEDYFANVDEYVDSLLALLGNPDLLRTLCGGVHLLDFFTTEPDLYSRILPLKWREFFAQHEILDLLDLFIREDLDQFSSASHETWRGVPCPPESLLQYLREVRRHLLDREVKGSQCSQNRTQKKIARHVAVGMTLKKVHEVGLYAAYIDNLATSLQASGRHEISHLIDFGSGQNYLGRALALEPYNRNIVAIESKSHNSQRAKEFDVKARIVEKERVIRNKKAHRAGETEPALQAAPPRSAQAKMKWPDVEGIGTGKVHYVDHRIQDGDLSDVVDRIALDDSTYEKSVMVVSLHSCGNLVHHGLRSLVLNPAVKAVAMVGCCYNLLTERLGPPTYKLPELRPTTHLHPRLRGAGQANGHACDPHGFPMSRRFCTAYGGEGVRLNITARMMAVQAPENWSVKDSEAFFARHLYRALLQRVFLDRGIVGPPREENCSGGSSEGEGSGGTPITIGSLRKGCYENFVAYVRGAMAKLCDGKDEADTSPGREALVERIRQKMNGITEAEIETYENEYRPRKKDLAVIWSLMAFSAGVVEAAIVVDRWLWLKEQGGVVGDAWVESVFDYSISPRNLVVVGVRK